MNRERYVYTQYCDDIRQEVGGKISLMGCYGPDLIAKSEAGPVVLPKLCAYVRVVSPIDRPFGRLVFKALLNDDVLAEVCTPDAPDQQLPAPPVVADARFTAVIAVLTFAPFALGEADGLLRVVVETEEGLIVGNALRLSIRSGPTVNH